MISGRGALAFAWRCPVCSGVYVGKALPFLHADEGTLLHGQLEQREALEVRSAATGTSTSSPTESGRAVRMRPWSRGTKETPSGSG